MAALYDKPKQTYTKEGIQETITEDEKKRKEEATARAEQEKKPMGGEYDALLEAAGKLEQPALDDKGEINPAFVEESQTAKDVLEERNRELSQQVQEQLQDPSSTQSTDWQGEVRDDGQATFGNIMSDGSQESGAAKAAREAREKAQAKQDAEFAAKPNTEQMRLGRGDERHLLPKDDPNYLPENTGRFAPGYGGKRAKGKLSDFRLDEGQGYGEFKEGKEGNIAEHEEKVAAKKKKGREASDERLRARTTQSTLPRGTA